MGRKLKKLPKAQKGLITGLKNIIKPKPRPILPPFNTGILPMSTTKIGNTPSLNFTDWADLMKTGDIQTMFPSFYSQVARQHIVPPLAPWNEFAANNLTGDLIRREINRGDGLAFDRGLMIHPAQNTGRKSVHFSSSGKPVVGHHMGDWSHAGTSLTLPISDAIRYNAMPRSVSLNDTYWYSPRQFVYPPSTKVFTGDMQLASNTKGIGLETTFSKDAMKLTKEINRINEMRWTPGGKLNYNETTGAGNFDSKKYNDYISLMTPLKNEMDLLHSNWLAGLNLKGININDPKYLLGVQDFKPSLNMDGQRSVRSNRSVPYTHSESPEFQLGYNKGTRLDDGTVIKDRSQRITLPDGRTMLDSYSLRDKIYGTKNFKDYTIKPSQSDLVIFQKEVFSYPKDYAELLLKRYDTEGLPKDSPFREILNKYVTDGTSHIKYQDGGSIVDELPNVFMNPYMNRSYHQDSNTIYVRPEDVDGPQIPFIGEHGPDHVLRHELEHFYQNEDLINTTPMAPTAGNYDILSNTTSFYSDDPMTNRLREDENLLMKDMYLSVLDPDGTDFWMQNLSLEELMKQTAFNNEAIPQLERQIMNYPANIRDYMLERIRNERAERLRFQSSIDVYNDPRTLEGQARISEVDGRHDAHVIEILKEKARQNEKEENYDGFIPGIEKVKRELNKKKNGGGLLKAQAGIPKSLLRLVPPKYRGNALSYLRKTYPNLDLRGNAPFIGGSSNIGVNELNLTNKNFLDLTNYEKGSLSFMNQQNLQPNPEFSNILQNYQNLNTDKNLALSLGNFASENPNAYFELLTQGTPSSTLTDMFKNPNLNIFNAQNKYVNMETPISTSPYAGNQRDNWTDEFEKNLRTYGNSGLFASNVPLMGPTSINKINVDQKNILTKGFPWSNLNIPPGYSPYDLTSIPGYSFNQTISPTAHYMATNSLMFPDPITNATRFRGSGDIANQHNFLMNMANKPSLILSGDKGYVGGPGSIENRMFYGGLDRPLPGKNVPSVNQSIIPQLTETFNLNQPFSGTFMKFPTTQTINRHFDGSIVGGNNSFLTNIHSPYKNFYPGLQLPNQTIFKKNFSLTNPFGQRGFIDQSGNPIDPNILPNFPSQIKQRGGELPKAQGGGVLKTFGKKLFNNTINPVSIKNPIGRTVNSIFPYTVTPKSKLLIPGRSYGDVSNKINSLVNNYQKEFSPMVWATGMSRHNLDEGSLFADGMTSRITQYMEPGSYKLNEPINLYDGNTRFWLGESMNKNWDDFYRGVQYENQHLFPEIKDLNLKFGYRPDKSAAWFYPDGTEYKDLPIPSAITKEYGGQTPWLSLDTKPDRLYKKGGEAKRTSITSYQNGGSIHPNQQVDYMKMFNAFIKEQEAGIDYMKNKNSSVMKPDGSEYYKMYEDGVFYPYYYENTDGTFEEMATIGYGTKGESIYEQYKEGMSIEEANMELQKSINEAFRRSSIYINGNYGENTWDNLSLQKQVMLADYAYNVGALSKFPNYTKAIMTDNTDLALKEYLRSEKKGGNKITRNEAYLNTFLQPWVDQTIITKKEKEEKEKLNLLNDTRDSIMKNKYDNWYSPFIPNTIENLWKTNYDWEDQYWKDKDIKTYQKGGEQKYSDQVMKDFMNYQKMIQSGFSEDLRNSAAQTYVKSLKREGIDIENMSQSEMFNLARTASEYGYVMPTQTYGDNPPTPQFIYNGNPISIEESDDAIGQFHGDTKIQELGDKVSQIPSSYFIDKKIKSEEEYYTAIKEYFKDDQDATRFLRDLESQDMLGEIPALMNRETINALRDYSNPEFSQDFADYLEYQKATGFLTNDKFFNKKDGWANYSKNYNENHVKNFTNQYLTGFGFDHKQQQEFLDYMEKGHTGNELYDNMITGLNKNIEHYNIGNIAGTGYKTPKGLLGTGDADFDLSTLKQGEYPHYLLDHRLAAWQNQSPSGSIIPSDYNPRENRYDTDWEGGFVNQAWQDLGKYLKHDAFHLGPSGGKNMFNFAFGDVLYGTVDWALNTAGGVLGIDGNRYEAGERFWENPTPGNFANVGIDAASFLPVGKLLKYGKNIIPGTVNTSKFLTQNLKNTPGWQNKIQLFKNNADDLYNFNRTMKNPSYGGGAFSNINTRSTLFPNNSLVPFTKPGYTPFRESGFLKTGPLLGGIGLGVGTQLTEQVNPYFFDPNNPNYLKTGLMHSMFGPNWTVPGMGTFNFDPLVEPTKNEGPAVVQ